MKVFIDHDVVHHVLLVDGRKKFLAAAKGENEEADDYKRPSAFSYKKRLKNCSKSVQKVRRKSLKKRWEMDKRRSVQV